ncbi:MAG: urease accessory UreF family protein [Pseudomonadota bacterium]
MPAFSTTDAALLRMMQLGSPALPVGAYAFSQGLEYAIDANWLRSVDDVHDWLQHQILHGLASVDLPLLMRLWQASADHDMRALAYWNAYVLACRETAEFRLSEIATGEALARLLPQLGIVLPDNLQPPTFLALFALAAHRWELSCEQAALCYAWSWLENHVMAATKILPLGQTQSQVLLMKLQTAIPEALGHANTLEDFQLGSSLPALAIASIKHETQYTRLFRS